jgi:hypothetical protein
MRSAPQAPIIVFVTVLTALALRPAAAAAQSVSVPMAVSAEAAFDVSVPMATSVRRVPSALESMAPRWAGMLPGEPAAAAAPLASDDSSVVMRDGSRGQFLLYMVGLVVVGSATYKLGEVTGIEAVESAGAFMAGAGLLAIIIPIWLFV